MTDYQKQQIIEQFLTATRDAYLAACIKNGVTPKVSFDDGTLAVVMTTAYGAALAEVLSSLS